MCLKFHSALLNDSSTVAVCRALQAMRSLAWQPRAVAVRAISEELAARGGEDGSFRFNGASVDAAAAVADPELDLPAAAEAPGDGNGSDGAGEAGPSNQPLSSPNGGSPPAAQDTLSVHAGEKAGRPRVADSLTTPIVQTSTYTFRNTAELIAYQEGRYGSYEYGRYGNPTTRTCEEKIRVLEGAEDCLVRTWCSHSYTHVLQGELGRSAWCASCCVFLTSRCCVRPRICK